MTDAASRHDYSKLANLGLQVSDCQLSIKPSTLRWKLSTFFTTRSPRQLAGATTPQGNSMNPYAVDTTTFPSRPLPKGSHTGWSKSCPQPSPQRPKVISPHFVPSISNSFSPPSHLATPMSTSSLEEINESMVRAPRDYDSHSHLPSSCDCSMKSDSTKRVLTSNPHSAWYLPPSYDLENLRGIHGPINTISSTSPGNMSSSSHTSMIEN